MGGRDQKGLVSLVRFVTRHVNDARFAKVAIEVADVLLDLYADELANNPSSQISKLFLELGRAVDRETRNMKNMMALQGSLDLILSASKSSRKPALRTEEEMVRRMWRESADGKADAVVEKESVTSKLTLGKLLYT